ncbi:MAG: amidase family protein [Bacteroidales bacterium]
MEPGTGDEWLFGRSASATSAGLVGFRSGRNPGAIVSPSTRCGVTGLRPTYGRVSRSGAMAIAGAWTRSDHLPVGRAAIVFDVIRGS